jgi:hypothetical protein
MSDEQTILDYLEDISNAILDIRSFAWAFQRPS